MAKRTVPGNIEARGTGHRVRLTVGGKRNVTFLPHTTLTEAENWAINEAAKLQQKHKKAVKRGTLGMDCAPPISELFDTFEAEHVPTLAPGAQRSYADTLKPLRAYFVDHLGDPECDAVSRGDVKRFQAWRRVRRMGQKDGPAPAPLSGRTVNKDVTVLHKVFGFAIEQEYVESNPAALVEDLNHDEREPVILDNDQNERLLGECGADPFLHFYALVLGETGVRSKSEALWLRWEDFDLAGGFVRITSGRGGHRTKSGKSRWVPMTGALAAAAREHFARFRFAMYGGKNSLWVFHHTSGGKGRVPGGRLVNPRTAFESAVDRAKLPEGFVQHDLRHRRCTVWLAEGKSLVHVQQAMGHSDPRVTMRYYSFAREHLRALVTDIPAGALATRRAELEQLAAEAERMASGVSVQRPARAA